ncbi:hypothetical protein IWX49DRAFT_393714 [Phyllosticta citricarpa]|uniref:Uncharacterized protein n=1 Tax=Phyllosticta citricarpa TaxID=55181 RepID=A0ABR1MFR1_9PEZI
MKAFSMAVCGTVGATSLRGAPGAIASPTHAQNGESSKNRAAWCWISQLSSRSSCKTPRNAPIFFVEDFSPVGNGLSGCSERICTREELWQRKYSTSFIPFVKMEEGTKHGTAFRHRLGEEFGACLLGVLTFFLICGFFVAISIIPFEKTGAKWLPGARYGLYAGYIVCFMGVVALLFEWSQQFARRALVFFVTGIIPFIVVATIIYRSAPPYGTILDCVPICFGVGLSCSCAWPYLSQRIRDQLAAFSLSWLARDSSSDSTAFDSTRT